MKVLICDTMFDENWPDRKRTIPPLYSQSYSRMFPWSPKWPSPRAIAFGRAFKREGREVVFCHKRDVLRVTEVHKPKLLFLTMNIDQTTMKKLRKLTKIWFWYRDCYKRGWGGKFKRAAEMAKLAQYCSTVTLEGVRELKKETRQSIYFMPHPIDLEHFVPQKNDIKYDVEFWGTKTKHRIKLLNVLRKEFTIDVWGEGLHGVGSEARRHYAELPASYRAHIHLNLGRKDEGYGIIPSSRIPRALACRRFVLSEIDDAMDLDPYIASQHVANFRTEKEMIEKVRHYLENPADIERITNNGYLFVKANYGVDNAVKRILKAAG